MDKLPALPPGIRSPMTSLSRVTLTYQVAMPEPTSHLFEVTLQVQGWQSPLLDLKMPVWTPGSYLVREYSRLVQDFQAIDLPSRKISKNHWQIETTQKSEITVKYRVFAHDLTVRTNHLDGSHGYFNGAALFFFIPGLEKHPLTLKILPPSPDWRVATPLPPVAGENNTFHVTDFDTLVDSPVEVGIHELHEFEVQGKPHRFAIWGKGHNANTAKMLKDTTKIIETESALFGGLPYDNYLFLLHLSAGGYGGLEHKNSCTLNYARLGMRDRDKYNRFLQLVAHEFFHLWNIKRIRPKALETFDYEGENYTSALWFAEGTTSYYDMIIPLRSGIYDAKEFLEIIGKEINRYLMTPGRKVQPLSEASFDAWIKLYRRDNNSDNNQISYYLKGELVSLLLDLFIRTRSENRHSLDDVLQLMWQNFGKDEIGYTDAELKSAIESVAGCDLSDFYRRYIDGLEELPFTEYLEPFGLYLKSVRDPDGVPYLGIRVQNEAGKEMIKFVEMGSPAQIAGIWADDELLAIEGLRVTGEQLPERLKDYRSGDIIQVTLFHLDELRSVSVTLTAPRPIRHEIARIENPSERQKVNFSAWVNSL
jgi:predicted metalloprotease with PDZ domain